MEKRDNFQAIFEGVSEKIELHESFTSKKIEPTGIQEDIIHAVTGVGRHQKRPRAVLVQTANKVGKTAMLIGGVLKNIFWKTDQDWFNYDAFNEWPYENDGRIVGTPKNVQDGGPIEKEIRKWWPRGRYKSYYRGKHHKSFYEIQGDKQVFTFDVMSYDQKRKEFEGPVLGWTLVDEPPPPDKLGAIFSRFYTGGILMLGMTPIEAGLIVDTLGDMERKGARVNTVTATIYENSTTSGKPNSKGTKRGLMTDEQIKDYISTTPEDEKEARLEGKTSSKSGKIYPSFDVSVHKVNFDLESNYMKSANHYMVMDPHPKYYPFIQWWAVTRDEKYICYNEWPTWDTLKAYYDEIRLIKPCSLTIEEMSKIIKIQDYSQIGYKILKRWPDPRFVKAYAQATEDKQQSTGGNQMARTIGFITEFAKYNIYFTLPPAERIAVQRDKIRALLKYEKMLPVNQFNEPKMYWHTQCRNSIRAMERHSWVESDKEQESEVFKDALDCTRMFLAGLGNKGYIDMSRKDEKPINNEEKVVDEYLGDYPNVGLT